MAPLTALAVLPTVWRRSWLIAVIVKGDGGCRWFRVAVGDGLVTLVCDNAPVDSHLRGLLQRRCFTHPQGDLETQLVADGLRQELIEILAPLGLHVGPSVSDEDLIVRLQDNKTAYAAPFAARIRGNLGLAQQAPQAFKAAIEQLPGLR